MLLPALLLNFLLVDSSYQLSMVNLNYWFSGYKDKDRYFWLIDNVGCWFDRKCTINNNWVWWTIPLGVRNGIFLKF